MINTAKTRKTLIVKCVTGAATILLLLWILLPRDNYTNSQLDDFIPGPPMQDDSSLEQCSIPYPGQPSTQYAVMIDAGSSGSRVHIYKFNICKEEPELIDEVFKMLEPGLSSYEHDPQAAAESLDSLMQTAVDSVPAELHHCTPVSVKATAGLRQLGRDTSDMILQAVRHRLETNYPFPIQQGEHGVEIMDGKDEGVFAWITVNYLLGRLKKAQRGTSVAVFDLGGASTQIVFEPAFSHGSEMLEGEHKYLLDYQSNDYTLYQHSYLGYGLNKAQERIKRELVESSKGEALGTGTVHHPCLPANYTDAILWDYEGESHQVTLMGTGAGHAECRAVVERVFNKNKPCSLSPCAFDGVYQPPFVDTFVARDLYVFSYFYDLTQPLGMPNEFSVQELGDLARRICAGEVQTFAHVPGAAAKLAEKPDYCLQLTYIHSLLHTGYDIPSERLVRIAKKINGAETGWCLGASIAMINNATVCRTN